MLGLVSILASVGLGTGRATPAWIALGAVVAGGWGVLAAYLLSPPIVLGLPPRYLLSLLYGPFYMVWKLSVGGRKPPGRWVRTPREAVPSESAAGSEK